jgi:hypothetical protein
MPRAREVTVRNAAKILGKALMSALLLKVDCFCLRKKSFRTTGAKRHRRYRREIPQDKHVATVFDYGFKIVLNDVSH